MKKAKSIAKRYDFKVNESLEGETIEIMIERLINNGDDERIETKELIYTRPEEGVLAGFNIRHDWWDDGAEKASIMAERAMELDGARLKKREELLRQQKEEDKYLKEHAKEQVQAKKAGENGNNAE